MSEQEVKPKIKRSLFRKIINVFIGMVLGILLLIILLVGFSQTFTFREWLRNKVITLANEELNGRLNIERIDGTILTSIFLRNTSLTVAKDTLFFAKRIEIKTSPLQLLIKKIYFRKILLEDLEINLLQDSTGQWNYAKLTKPSEKDTTASSFPFTIQIIDLRLKNISLNQQAFDYANSNAVYKTANFDDLRIDNLYLAAQAFIDIDNSDFLIQLKEFSFKPNLQRFTLRNISGDFAITKNFVNISNFAFISDSSDIRIDLKLDSLNIFSGVELEDFKNCPTTLKLDAVSFNFDDLSSFIGSTEILKGNPSLELIGHGKFGDINIDKAVLDYKTTHFEFAGRLLNLNTPEKLLIKAEIKDSDINYKDINLLLPTLELPEFAKLSVSSVNATFDGEPTNFISKFSAEVEDGKLEFDCAMNLDAEPITYDIKFDTENLNLMSVIGMNTLLNMAGSLKGQGVSPTELNSKFNLNIVESSFNDVTIEDMVIKSRAADRKINTSLDGYSGKSSAVIYTEMVFDNDTIPTYSLTGSIKKLDISEFLKDDNYKSDLNFFFSAEGRNIDPDKINGIFSFGVDSSMYRNTPIPFSNIDIVLNTDSSGRTINLESDFVDFNISGNFSLKKAVELIAYEASTISNVLANKINELNPLNIVDQSGNADSVSVPIPDIINDDLHFDFDFQFKNFDLIASLIGNNRLDIVGSGRGAVNNLSPNFCIDTHLDLNYVIFMQKGLTIYLSDIISDINLTRDNRFESFDKLSGKLSLEGKRFYSSVNVENIKADISFTESKMNYNLSADIGQNISTSASGNIFITPIQQQLFINEFAFSLNGLKWINDGPVKIFFNPYRFSIADCTLKSDSTVLTAEGSIENNGTMDIKLKAEKISGKVFTHLIMDQFNPDFNVDGKINLSIRGDFDYPVIVSSMTLDNLTYKNYKLGSLAGKLNYDEQTISAEFFFLDLTKNYSSPYASLKGTIPIDLSFSSVENRYPENKFIDMRFIADNFNIRSLGNLVPMIANQNGNINSNIYFSGTLKNPEYRGYLDLKNGYFTSTSNNLDYSLGTKLKFEDNEIIVDSFTVANSAGTRFPGRIAGNGSIKFENFQIKDLIFRLNGDLAILSPQSASVSPFFYGDLVIATNGDAVLSKNSSKYFFNGGIILRRTDLTYTTTQDQTAKSSNYNFIYVIDSTKIDKEFVRFQEILSAEKEEQIVKESDGGSAVNFDYAIKVSVENSARAVFILSQAANQKLFVEMRGDLEYDSYEGETRAQGAFELMNGSKLDFLGKAFDASGFIRFESDITNPFLDVTATYQNEYIDPQNLKSAPEEVAVKIRIRGPLTDLGKNLSSNQESIGVYYGIRNIQNNTRDSRYDYSDAFSFILFGKFKEDLTAQDKTNLGGQSSNLIGDIGNTATSFLGSVLTSFVNSAVGDLINNIQISNTGDYTKFSLSGRTQNLKYSFGGTTEVFQDIGRANFKLEYGSTFLIRLERRDPILQTNMFGEKINEIALKYRFEF